MSQSHLARHKSHPVSLANPRNIIKSNGRKNIEFDPSCSTFFQSRSRGKQGMVGRNISEKREIHRVKFIFHLHIPVRYISETINIAHPFTNRQLYPSLSTLSLNRKKKGKQKRLPETRPGHIRPTCHAATPGKHGQKEEIS
jgi:hypothetical protein